MIERQIPTEEVRAVILNAVLETTVEVHDAEILADLVEMGVMVAGYTDDDVLVFAPAHPDLEVVFGPGLFTIGDGHE